MGRRLLHIKSRNVRALTGLLLASLTVIGFQNCAPQPLTANEESGSASNSSTSSSSSSGRGSSSSSIWGSRPGSSSGGTVYGGGSSSAGGGTIIGGGGGGGTASGATDTTFRITQQPQNVGVLEGGRYQIEVVVLGGKTPYSYQWYKNGQPVPDGLGAYSFIADEATSYTKEGTYYAVIKDAAGLSLQSSTARLVIQEPAVGCTAGSYFTYTAENYDVSYKYFGEFFDGPRGKFLLHSSFDTYNFLYPNRKFTGLQDYSVPQDLAYLGKTWISCRTSVPRIHTPLRNPSYSIFSGSSAYSDNASWTYQGQIEFECRNKKLKLVSNTCKWMPR